MAKEKTIIESDTPAWLAQQVRQAEAATPISPEDIPFDDSEGEVFKGEETMAKENLTESDQIIDKIREKKAERAAAEEKTTPPSAEFKDIASELASMLESKNRKYGDSYAKMAHVLPLFYPDGVPGDNLLDAIFILRIIDKLMRIASDQRDDDEDPVADIAGYAILRMREMRAR